MGNKKRIPALILLICTLGVLSGCRNILQPQRADLAGISYSFMNEPVRLDIHIESIRGNTVMWYDSSVLMKQEDAVYDGETTVYYLGAYFEQSCYSLCNSEGSGKKWGQWWVQSDTASPYGQVIAWLDLAKSRGSYDTRPVTFASVVDGAGEGSVYCIRFENLPVDWKSLCDANFDSLFGGQALLTDFQVCNAILCFDTETGVLRGIKLTSLLGEGEYLSAEIFVSAAEEAPNADLSGIRFSQGYLSEHWDVLTVSDDE